jgi:hypothetical protein
MKATTALTTAPKTMPPRRFSTMARVYSPIKQVEALAMKIAYPSENPSASRKALNLSNRVGDGVAEHRNVLLDHSDGDGSEERRDDTPRQRNSETPPP